MTGKGVLVWDGRWIFWQIRRGAGCVAAGRALVKKLFALAEFIATGRSGS
jgi:hypothetical protein